MQSPTIIAGLRRIATSLWLHFVASPQRVPVFGHRRRGRSVVNVIYRIPPQSSNVATSATRGCELRVASGCVHSARKTGLRHRCRIHEHRSTDHYLWS